MNDIAYSSGGFRSIEPPYIVETQLKTFMALGTATIKVRNEKNHRDPTLMPAVNI
jgi:hypothetical protein